MPGVQLPHTSCLWLSLALAMTLWQGSGRAHADVREGLVAEYRFDEAVGSIAHDSSGHDLHGRLVGAPRWVPGYYGHGLQFDGIKDYVEIGHHEQLNVPQYTLAAWFLSDGHTHDPARQEILEKAGAYWLNIRTDSQRMRAGGLFGGCKGPSYWHYLDTAHVVPYEAWTHVASTFDGQTLSIYLNGLLAASTSEARPLCQTQRTPLIIGAKKPDDRAPAEAFFSGILDEVRLYARVLSPSEIQRVMRAARTASTAR
jgi:Concanavalin A-like lectin/glucanases superfamily